jgi:hypothetical protein
MTTPGYATLSDLLRDWSSTNIKDGDDVRRRLGTVGVQSPLFRIDKALQVGDER